MRRSACSHPSCQHCLPSGDCVRTKSAWSGGIHGGKSLAGPALAHAADRWRRHGLSLCACATAAAMAGVGYLTLSGFRGLLTVALVHAVALAPIVPVSDALDTAAGKARSLGDALIRLAAQPVACRVHRRHLLYRMDGSWGRLGEHYLVQWLVPAHWRRHRTAASRHWRNPAHRFGLPHTHPARLRAIAASGAIPAYPLHRSFGRGKPCSEMHSFSVITWRSAGISLSTISFLWSESVMAEVLVFLLIGPSLIRRIGAGGAVDWRLRRALSGGRFWPSPPRHCVDGC